MRFLVIFMMIIFVTSNLQASWTCQTQHDPIEDSNLNICQTTSLKEDGYNSNEQLILRLRGNDLAIFLNLGINTENINKIEVKFDKQLKQTYSVVPSSDKSSIFIDYDLIDFGKNILDNNHVYIRFLSDNNFLKTIHFDISKFESKSSSQLVKKIVQFDNERKEQIKQMQNIREIFMRQNEENQKKSQEQQKKLKDDEINRKDLPGWGASPIIKSPASGSGMRLESGKFIEP